MVERSLLYREPRFAKDPDELQAFIRSLRRRQGFAIEFVDCLPGEVGRLVDYVQENVPKKKTEILKLPRQIDNLYEIIAALPNRDNIDILFVDDIDKSIEHDIKSGTEENFGGAGGYYNFDTVPGILSHLNLQRERFYQDFEICFVFIAPPFVRKYFIQRAPDFFDWRAGVYRLSGDESQPAFAYPQELEENTKGLELLKLGHYEEAIASYDRALDIKPDDHEAWYNRGNALVNLGRYEEAIASYNRALKVKSDTHQAWNNRGNTLSNLGRYEEAIASFDHTLEIKPDDYMAWGSRGLALINLGRSKEAVTSFDYALQINPDDHIAWNSHGIALVNLGRYEEAIASYDRALKIKPDRHEAWYNRAGGHALLGHLEEALSDLQQAIAFDQSYRNMAASDSDFNKIRDNPAFQALVAPQPQTDN